MGLKTEEWQIMPKKNFFPQFLNLYDLLKKLKTKLNYTYSESTIGDVSRKKDSIIAKCPWKHFRCI